MPYTTDFFGKVVENYHCVGKQMEELILINASCKWIEGESVSARCAVFIESDHLGFE